MAAEEKPDSQPASLPAGMEAVSTGPYFALLRIASHCRNGIKLVV